MGRGYLLYLKGLGFCLKRTKRNVWVTDWHAMVSQMVFADKITILHIVRHSEVPAGKGLLLTSLTPKLRKMLKPELLAPS